MKDDVDPVRLKYFRKKSAEYIQTMRSAGFTRVSIWVPNEEAELYVQENRYEIAKSLATKVAKASTVDAAQPDSWLENFATKSTPRGAVKKLVHMSTLEEKYGDAWAQLEAGKQTKIAKLKGEYNKFRQKYLIARQSAEVEAAAVESRASMVLEFSKSYLYAKAALETLNYMILLTEG